jgi:hypothetical protein
MTMGPTSANAQGRALRIDSVSASGSMALHRAESGFGDNPSGLPVGRTRLKNLHVRMVMSQPASGQLDVAADADAPLPSQPLAHPGMTPAQLQQASRALLAQIRGTVQMRCSASLLRGLPTPTLSRLLQAGYILRQGNDVVSRIVFDGGHLTVNGHMLGS